MPSAPNTELGWLSAEPSLIHPLCQGICSLSLAAISGDVAQFWPMRIKSFLGCGLWGLLEQMVSHNKTEI